MGSGSNINLCVLLIRRMGVNNICFCQAIHNMAEHEDNAINLITELSLNNFALKLEGSNGLSHNINNGIAAE